MSTQGRFAHVLEGLRAVMNLGSHVCYAGTGIWQAHKWRSNGGEMLIGMPLRLTGVGVKEDRGENGAELGSGSAVNEP